MDLKAGVTSAAVSRDPNEITPADSPLRFEDAMASPVIQRISTPTLAVGDAAYDFAFGELNDGVAAAYGAWPDRLYLIDRDGRIAVRGEKGPSGVVPHQ